MRIVHAMMADDSRNENVVKNFSHSLPYVDCAVLVNGGDIPLEVESWDRVITVYRRWDDQFTHQRNTYITKVGDLAEKWSEPVLLCVSDDDEFYTEPLWKSIRDIGQRAWEDDINVLRVRAKDTTVNRKGEVLDTRLAEWYKPLIFVYEPGMHYVGIGNSEVHEHMIMPSGYRIAHLGQDPDSHLYYEHVKEYGVIWPRAARNFFAGGGGPNLGETQSLWKPFREMVRRLTGIERSNDFLKYLERGNIHKEIKDWFIRYRFEGTSEFGAHEGRKDSYDGSSEVREQFLAYFVYYHPEELDPALALADKQRGYIDYVAEISKIHGEEAVKTIGTAHGG